MQPWRRRDLPSTFDMADIKRFLDDGGGVDARPVHWAQQGMAQGECQTGRIRRRGLGQKDEATERKQTDAGWQTRSLTLVTHTLRNHSPVLLHGRTANLQMGLQVQVRSPQAHGMASYPCCVSIVVVPFSWS